MRKVYLLMTLLCVAAKGFSATYHNKTGLAISSPANWSVNSDGTGASPANFTTSGDIFLLDNTPAATALGASISFGANVTLNVATTVSTGSNAFGLTFAGTNSTLLVSTGTLNFTGTGTLAFTGSSVFTINSTGTVDMGTTTVSGIALATTITNNGLFKTANTSGSPYPQNRPWGGAGTINFYASGNQTIPQNNACCSIQTSGSGTKTAGGAIDLNDGCGLTIGTGTTFVQAGALTIGGNFTNNGTFTSPTTASGNVTFNSSAPGRTISGNLTGSNKFGNNVTFNSATGSWTFNNSAEIGNNFVDNNGTVTGPPSGTLTVGGNFRVDVAFNHNNGTVVLTGTTPNLNGSATSVTFNNLTLNTTSASTATMSTYNIVVNGALTITSGKLSLGSLMLTLNGTVSGMSSSNYLTANGSSTLVIGTSSALGTLYFDQTSPSTSNAINNLTMNGTGSATLGNALYVGSNFYLYNGTFTNSTFLTMGGAAAIHRDNGTLSAVPTWSSPGIVNYTTGGPGASPVTVGNEWPSTFTGTITVNKSGATLRLDGSKTLTGALTLTAGALDATTSNYDLSLTGNWTNNSGTAAFVPRGGTVSFNGSSAQTLGGSSTSTQFNNITSTNTAGLNVNTNTNVSGTLNVNGTSAVVTPAAGIVFNSGSTAGTVTGTGTIKVTRTSVPADFATQYNFVTYSLGNIVTDFSGAGSQFITGSATVGNYGSILLTGGGTKTMGGDIQLNNALTINTANTLDASATNYAMTVGGNWTNSGSFNAQSGTVTFINTTSGSISGGVTGSNKFYNLTFNGVGGSWALPANVDVGNDFTITNGTVTAPSGLLQVYGSWSNAGTFTHNNGTVSMLATASGKTLSGSMTGSNAFKNLTFNSSTGGWAMSNGADVAGNLSLLAGTVTGPTSTLQVAGTFSNSATYNHNGGTVAFNGSSAQSIAGSTSTTFSGLTLNNASDVTLASADARVNGVLTLTSGKLTLGIYNLTLAPAATIAGTLNSSNMINVNSTGTVRKEFSSTGSFDFPVGEGTNYTPASLNFTGGTFGAGAYASVRVTGAKHPNNGNGTNYVNRYWTVGLSGMTSPSYSATAMYVPADVVGTESAISMGRYSGSLPWLKDGSTSTVTHTLSSSIVGGPADFTGIMSAPPLGTVTATPGSVCLGSASTLTVTATGDAPFSYTWAPSTGLSATTGASVTATPPTAGTITYTVTITDVNGFTNTATTILTVTPAPAITGTYTVCSGSSVTLGATLGGGSWTSTNATVATIGSLDGILVGALAGTSTISYSVPGCTVATQVVTVLATPAAIGGTLNTCVGSTTTLTNSVSGGAWSSSATAIATIGTAGIATGVSAGTTTITYSKAGCYVTAELTVDAAPASLGTLTACTGTTTTLSYPSSPGGTWSSSNLAVGTIGASSGVFSALVNGTTTIRYDLTPTCKTSSVMTVNVTPAAIGGSSSVCIGANITLTEATAGGTWSSSDPSIATATGNVIHGVAAGTVTISYIMSSGCYQTKIVTVNSLPGPITGMTAICPGITTTVSAIPTGGTWATSNAGVATVGSSSGIVTGMAMGTANITYTAPVTGCKTWEMATVNALPPGITGTNSVCQGSTTALSNTAAGGTWTSGNISVATIDLTSGVATGVLPGTTTISYNVGSGCYRTTTLTVNILPTFSGSSTVCQGSSVTLTTSPGTGTWSSSNTAVATATGIISGNGLVTGIAAGTAEVTYILPTTGCKAIAVMTVNALPAPTTGSLTLCPGGTTTLSNPTPSGTWSSSPTSIATVDAAGVVTGVASGTANISYTMPVIAGGCSRIVVATVYPTPAAISGSSTVCEGSIITLSDASAGGTWSIVSGSTNASVNVTSGVVTGITAGTAVVGYTVTTGCSTTKVVTVIAAPAALTGTAILCVGGTTTMGSATPGGIWSSNAPTVASIVSPSGVATGTGVGTAIISYTISSTGCRSTAVLTVNGLPGSITGITTGCIGATSTLSSSTPGGNWTSSIPTIASITSAGVVSYLAAGTTLISYTLSTGCQRVTTVNVNPLPAPLTGATNVCESQSTLLTSATAGGTWMANNSNAVVGLTSGMVTGLIAGTSTIIYTLPTGCIATKAMTIDQLPAAITGIPSLCPSTTTTLASATFGGTWSSSNAFVATVNPSTGVVSAAGPGTTTIQYTLSNGCAVSKPVTVNPLPTSIGGVAVVCAGNTTSLNNATGGGVWTSGATGIATVTPTTALVTGIAPGTATISYIVGTGCIRTQVVTVNTSPAAISGSPSVCAGTTTTLTNATTGGTWSSSALAYAQVGMSTGIVTGIASGTSTISYKLANGCYSTHAMVVAQSPGAITGGSAVCVNSTITLGNAISGGTWTNSPTTIATIDPSGGDLLGVSAGTTSVTYTILTGCTRVATITVNPVPAPITGTATVCPGATSTLADATPGGTWSPSTASVAIINSAGVVFAGSLPGTTRISYTLPTGCRATTVVTVNTAPTISGTLLVCMGQSTTLTGSDPGGTWASSNTSVATVSPTGVVDGYVNNIATISYTAPSGCVKTVVVTVSPTPALIISAPTVCKGATTTAAIATTGGTWSSSNPTVAFIATTTGVITGLDTGTVNISYTSAAGCYRTTTINVLPLPAPIVGASTMCSGTTITLTNDSLGGTWSSSNSTVAPIDVTTGVLSGLNVGTFTITYKMPNNCRTLKVVTVTATPAPIGGTTSICQGTTVTLTNTTPSGSWSSSAPLIASVPTVPGYVSGLGLGTATITYKLSTGCQRTTTVTVNPIPDAITGTMVFCAGSTTTLSNSTPGGTWSSSNGMIALAGSSTGIITGVTGGTALITYKLATGCISMTIITVNPTPSAITGVNQVCEGNSTMLSNTLTGGIWTSSNPGIALVNSVGNVSGISAGTATITYATSAGCYRVLNVLVHPVPAAITGTATVCQGSTTILASATSGGTWISGNPSVATIGGPGIVTGISGGTAIMTYKLASTGCITLQTVTVNTVPAAILGTSGMCEGSSITLTNATAGGSWVSGATTIATVGPSTGVVTGVANGTTAISYTLPTGCAATAIVTVYAMPTSITGVMNICAGTATTFSNATTGGTWTSSNTSIATVGSTTGIVTAIVPGTATITYMLPFGCRSTATVTVSPFAAPITGITNICAGATSTLSNATTGGTWSSGSTAIATVDATSGVVTGVAAGTTTITYTTPSGCQMTTMMLVTPIPSTITGLTVVCAGSNVTLSNSIGGGLWSSGDVTIATVAGIGAVTGVSAGTVNITYSLGACSTSTIVTVNPAPPAISGFTAVCTQMTTLLTNATAGGAWSSSNPAVASIDASGTVSGLTAGTSIITYVLTAGCYTTVTMVVNTAPLATINIHPAGDLCSNTKFQNIGTTVGAPAGVIYTWSALNAVLNYISPDRRNCIVSFPTAGAAIIMLQSQVSTTGCIVTDTFTTNVTTNVSPTPGIVYYSPHLVCTDYTADSYQWGYDDQVTFDSTKYPGEVNQDLLMPTLDLVNKAYWVITTHQGCMQKTYYNRPTSVNGVARNITFVNLYPNPANTVINIEAGKEDIEVKLYDMLGKQLQSATLENGKGSLDVSRLAAGTYSAVLFSNGEKVAVKTFVKN